MENLKCLYVFVRAEAWGGYSSALRLRLYCRRLKLLGLIEVTVQVALEQDDALKTRNTVLIYLVLPVAVWISY